MVSASKSRDAPQTLPNKIRLRRETAAKWYTIKERYGITYSEIADRMVDAVVAGCISLERNTAPTSVPNHP